MTIRQLQMLTVFSEQNFTPKKALELNQNTFGSLCYRKWVIYQYDNRGKGHFILSKVGKTVLQSAYLIKEYRKHNNNMFSKRVHIPRNKVVVIGGRKSAAA